MVADEQYDSDQHGAGLKADAVDEQPSLFAAHRRNDVELREPRGTGYSALPGFMEKPERYDSHERRRHGQRRKAKQIEYGQYKKTGHEAIASIEARRDQQRDQQRGTGSDTAEYAEECGHLVFDGIG